MNGKAMMAGTTIPHIPSGAELVGRNYIVVITDSRQIVASFHQAQFVDVAGDSEKLYPDPSRSHSLDSLFDLESSG